MHEHEARRRDQVGNTTLGMLLLGITLAPGLVASDAGTWRGSVTVRAPDLQAGYRELEKDTAHVKQMLEAAAGNGAAVSVASVTTRTVYETGPAGVQTGRVAG
jgi:hypothetical protein